MSKFKEIIYKDGIPNSDNPLYIQSMGINHFKEDLVIAFKIDGYVKGYSLSLDFCFKYKIIDLDKLLEHINEGL